MKDKSLYIWCNGSLASNIPFYIILTDHKKWITYRYIDDDMHSYRTREKFLNENARKLNELEALFYI